LFIPGEHPGDGDPDPGPDELAGQYVAPEAAALGGREQVAGEGGQRRPDHCGHSPLDENYQVADCV